MLFGRSRNLIGLDIGDSSVSVVELSEVGKGRGWQLQTLASLRASCSACQSIVAIAVNDSCSRAQCSSSGWFYSVVAARPCGRGVSGIRSPVVGGERPSRSSAPPQPHCPPIHQ